MFLSGNCFRKLMTLSRPIPGDVNVDHSVKVVPARFLYRKLYTILCILHI